MNTITTRTVFLLLAGAAIGSVATWTVVGAGPRAIQDFFLTSEQRAVKAWLLENSNEPETLWIEQWEPVRRMPPSLIGNEKYKFTDPYHNDLGVCDRSISVKYRDNERIFGRIRRDLTLFLDGPSKVIASSNIAYVRCTVAEDRHVRAQEKAREQAVAAERAEYQQRFGTGNSFLLHRRSK